MTANPPTASNSNLRGIAAMILSAATFVTNDTFMKLAMANLPPLEVLTLRGIAGCLWCLPTLAVLGLLGHLPGALHRFVLLRAAFESAAVVLFVILLARMPIGDLTAIMQTTPLMVVLGVALIWREKIGPLRLVLCGVGFLGALLVAQPGTASASAIAPLGFFAAVFAAARDLTARRIPSEIPPLIATFTTIVMVMTTAAIGSWLFETAVRPAMSDLGLIVVAGLLLMFGNMFIILAFRLGTAGAVAPFYYAFTFWAVLSSVLVFGAIPNPLAILGIGLILGSGLAVLLFDQRRPTAAPAI